MEVNEHSYEAARIACACQFGEREREREPDGGERVYDAHASEVQVLSSLRRPGYICTTSLNHSARSGPSLPFRRYIEMLEWFIGRLYGCDVGVHSEETINCVEYGFREFDRLLPMCWGRRTVKPRRSNSSFDLNDPSASPSLV